MEFLTLKEDTKSEIHPAVLDILKKKSLYKKETFKMNKKYKKTNFIKKLLNLLKQEHKNNFNSKISKNLSSNINYTNSFNLIEELFKMDIFEMNCLKHKNDRNLLNDLDENKYTNKEIKNQNNRINILENNILDEKNFIIDNTSDKKFNCFIKKLKEEDILSKNFINKEENFIDSNIYNNFSARDNKRRKTIFISSKDIITAKLNFVNTSLENLLQNKREYK